jgi:hypothetical protein
MNSNQGNNITPEDPQNEQDKQDNNQGQPGQTTSPQLHEAALHGLPGRIVRLLAPHTEAHPAAILLQLLASFGNLIGPGPHCMVESTRHALNLFVILVGDSSKARKGTSHTQPTSGRPATFWSTLAACPDA